MITRPAFIVPIGHFGLELVSKWNHLLEKRWNQRSVVTAKVLAMIYKSMKTEVMNKILLSWNWTMTCKLENHSLPQ